MATARTQLHKGMQGVLGVAQWPPLVYIVLGIALGAIWALGTSVQVMTSEAWIMGVKMKEVNFTAFGQLWQAITGQLPPEMLIPFIWGWGVQFALIVASIGVELPRRPAWRFWLAVSVIVGLIGINACGDFVSSSDYGFGGQCGFTVVIFFVTFCMLLFSIMSFKHAWDKMQHNL
jgi:nicotinamide riboside transporter PnuC